MTFVGKILVLVIMAFSLFFLAISTVVFTTSRDWKASATSLKGDITKLQAAKTQAETERDTALAAKAEAEAELVRQVAQDETRINEVQSANDLARQELTELRTAATEAQQKVSVALDEAEARRQETEQLRGLLSQVQQQANELQLRQTELNTEILQLERFLETAQKNNSDLRERVGLYSNVIRRAGLTDDVQQLRGVSTAPPDVQGQVVQTDSNNRRVVISIGSDDGLVVGHELELWRSEPSPDYLGRIRIETIEPDRAVGSVIGNTVQGKKIQEGDIVSTQIRPRG